MRIGRVLYGHWLVGWSLVGIATGIMTTNNLISVIIGQLYPISVYSKCILYYYTIIHLLISKREDKKMVILQIMLPGGKKISNSKFFPDNWQKTCKYRFVFRTSKGGLFCLYVVVLV